MLITTEGLIFACKTNNNSSKVIMFLAVSNIIPPNKQLERLLTSTDLNTFFESPANSNAIYKFYRNSSSSLVFIPWAGTTATLFVSAVVGHAMEMNH